VGPRWHWHNALFAEVIGTFVLVTVVLQTACNPKSSGNRAQACIAIGLAVFAAHTVLIPIDGCSINPTRSFGPALLAFTRQTEMKPGAQVLAPVAVVSPTEGNITIPAPLVVHTKEDGPAPWNDMWIFWVGPLLGAALAAGVYNFMLAVEPQKPKEGKLLGKEGTEGSSDEENCCN